VARSYVNKPLFFGKPAIRNGPDLPAASDPGPAMGTVAEHSIRSE